MTSPSLAICFPVGMDAVPFAFALRSISALAAQTCRDFEVVCAVDSATPIAARGEHVQRLMAAGAARVVHVERMAGFETVAHRNHARNAAWQAATAPLCLMLDADFILPSHAVETIMSEHRRLFREGVPAVMSPALSQFGGASTDEWIAASACYESWVSDPATFDAFLGAWQHIDRGTFSGFGERCDHPVVAPAPGVPVSASVGAAMIEGMPILPRPFLEFVGGFDEAYVGWGGDKISLVDALRGMCAEGIMELRVLTGVVAMHQPHATDPHHTSDLARRNEHRRQMARMEIQARNLGWRRRVGALGEAMHEGWKAAAAHLGVAMLAMDDPESRPPPEAIAAVVLALKSPRVAGLRVVVCGHDAVMRACAGQSKAEMSRGRLGQREATHCALVLVSPLDRADFADAAEKNGVLDGLRAHIDQTTPGGHVVVLQRLAELPVGGRAAPGYLRPVDMQDRLVKSSPGAQVFRAAGQTWALVTGRI